MKKLINDVSAVVTEMLGGLVALHPGLALLQGGSIVVRADAAEAAARATSSAPSRKVENAASMRGVRTA